MALPPFKSLVEDPKDIKLRQKHIDEVESVLHNSEALLKQFNKDLDCKDTNEVSIKLYAYKKNNLALFHKLLYNHFLNLCNNRENTLEQKPGKIEIKTDNESELTIIDNTEDISSEKVDECIEQQWGIDPQKNRKWSIFNNYKLDKKELPEYDTYSVQKLINADQFLYFAFDAIEKSKGYDEAIKTIYNKYIKEDTALLKQLKLYETYYMKLNENINSNVLDEINNVLTAYEISLLDEENEKMTNYIYQQISEMIDINTEMLEIMLESYNPTIKSSLYDFFKNNSVLDFVHKCEKSGISYNEIMELGSEEFMIGSEDEENLKLADSLNLDNRTTNVILMLMSSLELTNLLYIDNETSLTLVFFAIVAITFKNVFKI